MLRSFLSPVLIVIAAANAACATPAAQSAAEAGESDAVYRLSTGDKLRITVYNEPGMTGEYSINAAGEVAMPLIGDVPAKGETTSHLAGAIRTRLAGGYVKDPRVSVEVVNYRPYYILGEVNRPGEFPYSVGLTVEQAVAAAGGYTYRANRRRAFVRRAGEAERSVKFGSTALYVRPGDTIRIGERYF